MFSNIPIYSVGGDDTRVSASYRETLNMSDPAFIGTLSDIFDGIFGNVFGSIFLEITGGGYGPPRPVALASVLKGAGTGYLHRFWSPVFAVTSNYDPLVADYVETIDLGQGEGPRQQYGDYTVGMILRDFINYTNTLNPTGVRAESLRLRVALQANLAGLVLRGDNISINMSATARLRRRVDNTQYKEDYYTYVSSGSGGSAKSNKPRTITAIPHSFTLTYGALELTLPAPQIGDTETQQATRISRTSRGLTRKVYRSGDWYVLRLFDYRFVNLTLEKKEAFETLVRTAAGDKIDVVDHLGLDHEYYITDLGSIVEMKNDQCSYTVSAVFQEVK